MLDLFRKKGLTSFVYGFIIVATIAVFVIQFRPNAGQRAAAVREACVATVRGWCIDPKDHKSVYLVLMPRDREGQPSTARARAMNLQRVAADALIERELLVAEAERLGIRVTEDEVTESIFNGWIWMSAPSDRLELAGQFPILQDGRVVPQAFGGFRDPKTKRFDTKVFERTIKNFLRRSATEFREEQQREMLAAKVRDLVRAPVRVSDLEAFDAYVREKSHAEIASVQVKTAYAARWAVAALPADVEHWAKEKEYADLVDAFVKEMKPDAAPQSGHVRHILVKVEKGASEGDRTAAMNHVAEAARRVKTGERFADVARDVSQDFATRSKGGDLGDKLEGQEPSLRQVADQLKPGELATGAVETAEGYHLLFKDDPAPEAVRRDVARMLYVRQKAGDAAKDLATRILAAAKAGKTFEDATTDALAPLVKSGRAMPPMEVIAGSSRAVGGADGGSPAEGGDAGKAAIVMARAITPDDDPDKPRMDLSTSFNRGGDPLGEAGPETNQKVVAFAFAGKAGDVLAEPLKTDRAWIAVQLKDVSIATREQFDKDRETYTQTLLAGKRAEALAAHVRRLRESYKAEIKVDEAALTETKPDGGAPAAQEEEE